MNNNPFRNLPAVNDVLETATLLGLADSHPRALIADAVREELDLVREQLKNGADLDSEITVDLLAQRAAGRLSQQLQPKLRTVINATGIVLHTNLGRAPLADEAAKAVFDTSRGYLNLELDLETGKRSSRQIAIREWVCKLTGAESATVVNNNAAATVISLRALCGGKEAIVSRGQLIEIGGSFRIPDIMAVSGATLREVGTTNITRISDYEKAIGENTGALMQVHTSNYRISGFTKSASLEELVELGKKYGLPVIDDVGSGAMVDFARFGFSDEPVVKQSIAAGVDLVLFSGDKLLGGPQAGIIAGRKQWIQRIEKDPLMRAFRLDKMTLAALEATLRIYLDEDRAMREIPVLRMLGIPQEELRRRAENLGQQIKQLDGIRQVRILDDVAYVGGGSLPDQAMPTVVVEVQPETLSDTELAYRLRMGTPAVMSRLRGDHLVLDPRTIFPHQESLLIEALRRALSASSA